MTTTTTEESPEDKITKRAQNFLNARQRAYLHTFDLENEANLAVLSDLAKFCRANRSTFDPDARVHAVLEGRREVWLRLANHLRLSADDLWNLLNRKGG